MCQTQWERKKGHKLYEEIRKTQMGTNPRYRWTLDERYEKAKEVDLPGRSDRRKEDLARELKMAGVEV